MSALFALMAVPVTATSETYLQEQETVLRFGNAMVELEIDTQTGYFFDIKNLVTGIHHKVDRTGGSWPYGMRLGFGHCPDLLKVEIVPEAYFMQEMRYRLIEEEGGKTLEMAYDDLTSTGGGSTGVSMTVHITLRSKDDYFLISAEVFNDGEYDITNLHSGGAALTSGDSHSSEMFAAPGWSYGSVWKNPHQFFAQRETFGYPIFGSMAGLNAGWIDLYGEKGGIGVGYLNRQGMTMLFNVQAAGEGMLLNWQLFDLREPKAAATWAMVGGVSGLQPGKSFTTDSWILAPHEGDWHRMADIYRAEYEKAFEGDYLTWEHTPERAKNADVARTYIFLNVRDQFEKEATVTEFDKAPELVRQYMDETGVAPENLLLGMWGHSIHFPYYMPDFLPCAPEAGGDEGCRQMLSDLSAMGVNSVLLYAHIFYNHPKANDYVPEADTGYDQQNAIWKYIGNVACSEAEPWQALWRDKYLPGYSSLGAAGAFLDQGPTQYLVCPHDGHPHGDDSVRRLTAHVRSQLQIVKEFHNNFNGEPLLWTEGGSDLHMRYTDFWSAHKFEYARGGAIRQEIVRYTFPYRISTTGSMPGTPEDVNEALVNGFVLGGWAAEPVEDVEATQAAVRQFVRLRRELRQQNAPGYPEGFQDMNGLAVDGAGLVARSYRNESGITVVYYADSDVVGTIAVNPVALSFPDAPPESFSVRLAANEAGFRMFRLR